MTRLHEEWMTLVVGRLGDVAFSIGYGSSEKTLAERIRRLGLAIEHWERATRESTADGKLAVEEAFERTGAGWS